jgi:hypothetical protein
MYSVKSLSGLKKRSPLQSKLDYFLFFFLIFFRFSQVWPVGAGAIIMLLHRPKLRRDSGRRSRKEDSAANRCFNRRNTTLAPFLSLRLVFAVCTLALIWSHRTHSVSIDPNCSHVVIAAGCPSDRRAGNSVFFLTYREGR